MVIIDLKFCSISVHILMCEIPPYCSEVAYFPPKFGEAATYIGRICLKYEIPLKLTTK